MRSKRAAMCLSLLLTIAASNHAGHAAAAQDDDEAGEVVKIESLLQTQVDCWNDGDIDGFMETYWKSPDLTFSSGGATTRGWQETLERYKRRYSTRALMGHLTFSQLEIELLGVDAAFVLGRWQLQREEDKPEGNFSLVMKRIDGDWKIVHDHSSSLEE